MTKGAAYDVSRSLLTSAAIEKQHLDLPAFGFIRKGKTTDAARFDGRMLRDVVTNDNTASDVWADTA